MHLHTDGDVAGRSLTLTVEPLDNSGYAVGTPSGIQVRYVAQDVPISPWLAPSAWSYTITVDSPWLANLNDGVLDLNLQARTLPTRRAPRPSRSGCATLARARALSAAAAAPP